MGLDPGAALRKAAALLLLLPLLACAHSGVDMASLSSNSDEVVWEAAQKAYAKKNWGEIITEIAGVIVVLWFVSSPDSAIGTLNTIRQSIFG